MATSSSDHPSKRRRISNSQSHSPVNSRGRSRLNKRLPFNASELSKRHFEEYKPMFAIYLDLQKQIDIDDLSTEEAKGRWKSFIKKWNRGELAEGWYRPETKQKAVSSATHLSDSQAPLKPERASPDYRNNVAKGVHDDNDDDADEYGPALPESNSRTTSRPTAPTIQDLQMRDEMIAENTLLEREDIYYHRKHDRKQQKERLEELAPRAEPGTRERQLEKKREKADQMRSFRDKSPAAAEMVDTEAFGDDGIEGYKAKRQETERKKDERQIRKEELWRARAKEREERLEEHRAKESKTLNMLKALAKERFG